MKTIHEFLIVLTAIAMILSLGSTIASAESRVLFTEGWNFHHGDVHGGEDPRLNDASWRTLDLPHDWSIEGPFSKDNPASPDGGALPGGIGWYRKSFHLERLDPAKLLFIDFDGVYRNSDVWINGHHLGRRPYGYSSFRYELTPYLHVGANIIAVRVDNAAQPNSRWYSGSGIYRNVWMVTTGKVHVDHWGTFISASDVSDDSAKITIQVRVRNTAGSAQPVRIVTAIQDEDGHDVTNAISDLVVLSDTVSVLSQEAVIARPRLWSIAQPHLYHAITSIIRDGQKNDEYRTPFGVRAFVFDATRGLFLNGRQMKIRGVCNHHDLGCLGTAMNRRALQRQLEIMKAMGVNAIRTSHNPPAPELLELCDAMGFLVMDEAFDMWKMKKTEFDYSADWDAWHKRDLQDMVLRDRNHPSVIIWSIGNEVGEQRDSSGVEIATELAGVIRDLDTTRPITAACNHPFPKNPLIRSGALDLIGYNYDIADFPHFPEIFPGKRFIASETTSALATRGHYDVPSDSIRRWPPRGVRIFSTGNKDNTCSSYDNCSTPWGSTHEETWKIVKKYDFLSGMFIWTGFDYLGEPTPYSWPSRSSYFGIVDLAGFPKDAYYMYQSEWTDTPVLHLFPHWNWKDGDTVDVWAYTNCTEVELFLNGSSLGSKVKEGDDLHLWWRVPYVPGVLRAVGRTRDSATITREIRTAGAPSRLEMEVDRPIIAADGRDLAFVTVRVLDASGTLVPYAGNELRFTIDGEGAITGVDNGLQTSTESFQSNSRHAFNGLCLVVLKSSKKPGTIRLNASSAGLTGAAVHVESR